MSIEERHARLSRPASGFLVSACNPFSNEKQPAPIPPSHEIPDLLRAAELHGVLPFILRQLRRYEASMPRTVGFDEAARTAIAEARALQINQAGMELALRHHGDRVLDAFGHAGIPAAIVKGPTFADRLYAEPSLRTFTDIDVLIPTSSREASRAAMQGLGFEHHDRDYRAGRDYFEDVWLLAADPRISIEVHSDLVHNPKLRARASLTHDALTSAGGGDPRDATALLFVAATHGAMSHQFDRLQHLVDVARAASGAAGEIDWERLRLVCNVTGTKRAVVAAVSLAGKMFASRSLIRSADALRPSFGDRLGRNVITPATVLEARSARRGALSWRRKLFRQSLRSGRLVL